MIRVITTRVQASMVCDHPGCSNTIRMPERAPDLDRDIADINAFHVTASILGWTVEDDGDWNSPITCPNHNTPTKENNQ